MARVWLGLSLVPVFAAQGAGGFLPPSSSQGFGPEAAGAAPRQGGGHGLRQRRQCCCWAGDFGSQSTAVSQAAPSLHFLGGLGRAGTSAGSPGFPAACGSPEAASPAPASSGLWLPREPTGIWGFLSLAGSSLCSVSPVSPRPRQGAGLPSAGTTGTGGGAAFWGQLSPALCAPLTAQPRDVPWHSRSPSVPRDPPQAAPRLWRASNLQIKQTTRAESGSVVPRDGRRAGQELCALAQTLLQLTRGP